VPVGSRAITFQQKTRLYARECGGRVSLVISFATSAEIWMKSSHVSDCSRGGMQHALQLRLLKVLRLRAQKGNNNNLAFMSIDVR
jgi:hypothetical protein